MSEAGCEELEHKLETFVETVRQIGIIVHDFQPNSQTVLNRKLEEVVKGKGFYCFLYSFLLSDFSVKKVNLLVISIIDWRTFLIRSFQKRLAENFQKSVDSFSDSFSTVISRANVFLHVR